MEATKCLKPSDSGSRNGDRASVQAATRVNAEQASHDEGLDPHFDAESIATHNTSWDLEKVDVQADPATPSGEG